MVHYGTNMDILDSMSDPITGLSKELLGKRICMDSYVYTTKEVSICS